MNPYRVVIEETCRHTVYVEATDYSDAEVRAEDIVMTNPRDDEADSPDLRTVSIELLTAEGSEP